MIKKLKEEFFELTEEAKKIAVEFETFFKEKASRELPEEPELEESEIEKIAKIEEIREEVDEEILEYPNVVGVATGYRVKAGKVVPELCIQVLVEKKISETQLSQYEIIPKEINGIRTDVIATGKIEALTYKGRYRPAFPGCSIGHYKITAGTFGCIVQDKRDHDFLILSNNHVLANTNNANIGDPILQPGRYDGGGRMDIIARLKRFVPLVSGYNLVDAAVAKPLDMKYIKADIAKIGIPTGVREAVLGLQVQKTGRTTQHTTGRILSTNATVMVGYGPGVSYLFKNQIITTRMAAGGDSGSLLLDMSKRAVGLLFAGSPVITVHNNIYNVLMALEVELEPTQKYY
ncbi:conserved hypothetical protein [Methanocaldococcus sp. FS406-22]|uniref:hypothetical protein n=1 Tax=Methanocaldococcus sp. (strain FS406-22) TaxID=644281 RepID=UPI0001BF436B|nr:hypothetical protein [Methanocaldococcus sp. FS406-22]ADC69463.1 conserved hypothetical protein [Methanocaldococcus sp. FS406-22]